MRILKSSIGLLEPRRGQLGTGITSEITDSDFDLVGYLSKIGSPSVEENLDVVFVPNEKWRTDYPVWMPETFRLLKWAKANSDLKIGVPHQEYEVAGLHAHDFWMPLMIMASDAQTAVFLNLVSSYIYDKMKGAVSNEKSDVHFEMHVKTKSSVKRLKYEGPYEGFRDFAKKFDPNKF